MDGLIIGLLLPFAGTTLGAACVFLMKKQMPDLCPASATLLFIYYFSQSIFLISL